MGAELSWLRIAGVAVLLFSSILLGVGIHHLVATGTCSSTGYSGSFGPVPHCPSGTGWWIGFLMIGIFGGLAGAAMAGSSGLVFAGIFGAIGFGALTIVFDDNAAHGAKIFGAIFGGVFALVGVAALIVVLVGAIRSLRSARPAQVRYGKTKTSTRGPAPTASPTPPTSPQAMGIPTSTTATPMNLIPSLQAARMAAGPDAVDELSKLSELHQQGSLTDEEFASAKAKLLGKL
ncbi:MAG TPA: SHOCT domain-containing protein [Solirubrobacteraceae bacterium]